MMCDCPISTKNTPWYYKEFEVIAEIMKVGDKSITKKLPLIFDKNAPLGAPSQFSAQWQAPPNHTKKPEIYQISINAFQKKTGNTGIDFTTIIIPPKVKKANT